MMMDWKGYGDQVNAAVKEISAANPDIVLAYDALAQANARSTCLDAKTRALNALGVAISLRYDGCINAHNDAAIKAGASKEEIIDALGVAIMVNAGAALVHVARTVDAYDGRNASKTR